MEFKDGFIPTESALNSLEKFYSDVVEYNKKVNLTSITEREEFFIKHIWDSLAGQKYFPSGCSAAEVGSGGGFPSLPIKICRPDVAFTLFESVGKKCTFLREESAALELGGVSVQNMRAEDAGRDVRFREKFDVCCARAVARLNSLLEYCAPLVKKGGIFIAYKGDAAEEIEEADHAAKVLGMKKESDERYCLPSDLGVRTLVVYRKISSTPAEYPRGQGKERKSPL